MYCEKCGNLTNPEGSFCGKCGNRIREISVSQAIETQVVERKTHSKIYALIIAAILLVCVVVVAFLVLSKKQPGYYAKLAESLYDDGEFEKAIEKYDLELSIAPYNMDAYFGKILAYEAMGDMDEVRKVHEEAIDVINDLDSQQLDEYEDSIVLLYEKSRDIYGDDYEKLIQIYDEAVDNLPHEKDLSKTRKEIFEEQKLAEQKAVLMQDLYSYMKSKDYKGLTQYLLINGMDLITTDWKAPYIYSEGIAGASYSGTAVGIYQSEDKSYYYIYYGKYENGVRSGSGASYYIGDDDGCYATFEGTWKNDKPNGYGTLNDYDAHSDILNSSSGNYTDGMQNGTFSGKLEVNGSTLTTQWEVKNGVAKDLIDQITIVDLTEVRNQGYMVYSVYTDYYYYFFANTVKIGGKLGAIGFGSLGQ